MAVALKTRKTEGGMRVPPMIGVHGMSGVGKTTLGASAPKPIFIQTEQGEGLLQIDTFDFGKEGIATEYGEVTEDIDALIANEHDYQTLVIDSLDHLEPLMHDHLCKQNNAPTMDKGPFGYGAGYVAAANEWRVLMKKLNELRSHKNMAVILIAHSQHRKMDEPGQTQYDRWDLKLHAKSASVITETVDCLFYAKHQVKMRKEDKGFGAVKAIGIDTGERVLVAEGGPHVNAKNRYNLPAEFPLSWQAFEQALTQSIKPAKKETANG